MNAGLTSAQLAAAALDEEDRLLAIAAKLARTYATQQVAAELRGVASTIRVLARHLQEQPAAPVDQSNEGYRDRIYEARTAQLRGAKGVQR
jgi:hypothetical protein